MIVAVYNNNHSRSLIQDYLDLTFLDKPGNVYLVNIGKTSHISSPFCGVIAQREYVGPIKVAKQLILEIENYDGIVKLLLPNNNHLLCGVLLAFKDLHPTKIEVLQIAEGTLNYHERPSIGLKERSKRFLKKILGCVYFQNYKLSTQESMNLGTACSELICRNSKGIVASKSQKIIEIPSERFSTLECNHALVLILGQHITKEGMRWDNLCFERFKLEFGLDDNHTFYYAPHPRAVNEKTHELKHIYGSGIEIIESVVPAEDLVDCLSPMHVIALGGSSIFIDLATNPQLRLYAYGMDWLVDHGFQQYRTLAKMHSSLGVICYE